MSVRSPTVYSTNYSKRGDRKWYGYIKDRYSKQVYSPSRVHNIVIETDRAVS